MLGAERKHERVIRGGAWNGSFASWVRPSQRYAFTPDAKTHVIGFRCAESQSAVQQGGAKKPEK